MPASTAADRGRARGERERAGLTKEIAQAEASMEELINDVMPTLESDRRQKNVTEQKGLAALNAWIAQQDTNGKGSVLEPGEARSLMLQAGPVGHVSAPSAVAVPSSGGFNKFFDQK